MCFSAEASFTAAAVLGAIGVTLVKNYHQDKRFFVALIPLFFAIQQFSEGVVWVAFNKGVYPNTWSVIAQYTFLFFSEMFWPFWIPFAFAMSEQIYWRRTAMWIACAVGALFFLNNGYYFLTEATEHAAVVNQSIVYDEPPLLDRVIYGVVVLTPFILSSFYGMWFLGVAIAVAFIASDQIYHNAFVSVWCFFSALISGALYLALKKSTVPTESLQKN